MKLFCLSILLVFFTSQFGSSYYILNDKKTNETKSGLVKGKELKFLLDYTTVSFSSNYQYFKDDLGDSFLATITKVENSLFINVFDFDRKEILKKVEITNEGPNAIPSVLNFHIIDSKRILVYSYPTLITIIDFDGKILSKRNFLDIPYEAGFFTTKAAPILWNNNLGKVSTLVTPHLVNNADPNIPALALIDMGSGDMNFFLSRSNMDNITHKTVLALTSYTFNSTKNIYVSISQRGSKFHIQAPGGNEERIDVPPSIKLPTLKVYGKPEVSFEGAEKNDKFIQIVHDKWRSVYYLIKAKALTDADYKQRNLTQYESLPLDIIVLDEGFKVLDQIHVKRGEYYVQSGGVGLFVSPGGLHLMKYETESDDYMVFDTFEFVT